MIDSAKLQFEHLRSIVFEFVNRFTFISPYVLGIFIFSIFYLSLCSNDSNLDGEEYYRQGKYKKALKAYNTYLMLHPQHVKTLYNRGRCYDEMEKFELALADYEMVLELDPHNINALVSLSQYYYRSEDYEAAVNLSSYAANIDDDNYLAHYHLARASHKLGLVGDALSAYNKTIDLNPDFGFAYFQRSSLFLSIGFRPFGCHDLKVAISLGVDGAEDALEKYCK